MPKKPRVPCLNCQKETPRPGYKYCNNQCQAYYQYKSFIAEWLVGRHTGLQGHGVVSRHIKRFLREKYGNKCCICNWAEVNVRTGEVPLVADHIDGNWRNNTETNLRLICPNCDAISDTYAGLNRGNGRKQRVVSKRAQEGRLLNLRYAEVTQLVE